MNNIIIDIEKGRTSGDGMEEEEKPTTEQQKQLQTTKAAKTETAGAKPATTETTTTTTTNRKRTTSSSSAAAAAATKNQAPLPGLHTLYRRTNSQSRSLAPVKPHGELIQMVPRLIATTTTRSQISATEMSTKAPKTPKFIPYEPYPGAVNALLPHPNNDANDNQIRVPAAVANKQKANKNNLDIHVLVNQMSTMRTQELNVGAGVSVERQLTAAATSTSTAAEGHLTDGVAAPQTTSAAAANIVNNNNELLKLQAELTQIKQERDYYQNQFKFQTQVNAELKHLLVASVGEDLQTRVNLLTEDKLQLARALLDTANNLSTHTEQIEFLAGQCEVWRSKFLASSVMVEELARWKADLTQKNQMLNDSVKHLLHATQQIRDLQLEMLKNLKFLAKIRYLNLPATDVLSLSVENLNIAQQMVLHTGVGIPETNLNISSASANPLCEAEKYALQSLEFISQPLMATDEAIRALFAQTTRSYAGVAEQIALPDSQAQQRRSSNAQ